MEWGAGQTAYAVFGALFLAATVVSAGLRRQVSLATMHVLATGAATFLGLALAPPRALGTWQATAIAAVAVLAAALAPIAWGRDMARQRAVGVAPPAHGTAAPGVTYSARDRFGGPVDPPMWQEIGEGATGLQLASLAYRRPDLRVAIAAHPSTPASVLEWLAQLDDGRIREAINSRSPSRLP